MKLSYLIIPSLLKGQKTSHLSFRTMSLSCGLVCVGFVVDKMTTGQLSCRVLLCQPASAGYSHFILLPSAVLNKAPLSLYHILHFNNLYPFRLHSSSSLFKFLPPFCPASPFDACQYDRFPIINC